VCSRYELLVPFESVVAGTALRLAAGIGDDIKHAFHRGEVRPTDRAPVVLPDGGTALLAWGLRVSWQAQPVINARAETVAQKPTFKPLLNRRCLVPAGAYFEWRKNGRDKIKTRIHGADGTPLFFAGLTDGEGFTILTCAPAPAIAHIHDRMPVILDRAARAPWLDPTRPFAAVKHLLAPYAGKLSFEEPAPAKPRQGQLAL
jgi:putative SOS response-associated peptidase YedK